MEHLYKFIDIHLKISVLKSLLNTIRDLKAHNINKKEALIQVPSCDITNFLRIAV